MLQRLYRLWKNQDTRYRSPMQKLLDGFDQRTPLLRLSKMKYDAVNAYNACAMKTTAPTNLAKTSQLPAGPTPLLVHRLRHLADDVATANKLAADVQLRQGRPLAEGDTFSHHIVFENIDGVEITAGLAKY